MDSNRLKMLGKVSTVTHVVWKLEFIHNNNHSHNNILLKEIRFNTDRLQYIYEHIIRNYKVLS
jgi:hypothetical protein